MAASILSSSPMTASMERRPVEGSRSSDLGSTGPGMSAPPGLTQAFSLKAPSAPPSQMQKRHSSSPCIAMTESGGARASTSLPAKMNRGQRPKPR